MPERGPGRLRILGWLTLFLGFPMGLWLETSARTSFHGKSLSNLSLEPLVIGVLSLTVFLLWFLLSSRGLRPVVGLILLLILSAAALALERLVPALRE